LSVSDEVILFMFVVGSLASNSLAAASIGKVAEIPAAPQRAQVGAVQTSRPCLLFLEDEPMRNNMILAVTASVFAAAHEPMPLSTYVDANGFLDVQSLTCAQLAYHKWSRVVADHSRYNRGVVYVLREADHRTDGHPAQMPCGGA
jgi:hypothetical protein